MEIERRMEDKAQDLSTFEKLRSELKQRHDAVALEGYCSKCKTRYSIAFPLMDYLKVANFIPSKPVISDCALCKESVISST